jgi:translation initiation factor IF-2
LAKVHFFKLAQELGENPVTLQKRLAALGIRVPTTSSPVDEDTATRIREVARPVTPLSAEEPAPMAETRQPEAPPTAAPVVAAAPAAPIAPVAPPTPPAPAPPPEMKPATRVVRKVISETGGPTRTEVRSVVPGEGSKRPPRHGLMIHENEGGLGADIEFGIVKRAGEVPMPKPPPPRPMGPRPMGPGGPGPRPMGPRPMGGPGGGPPPAPDATKAGGPAKPGDAAKRKQKRTVFTEREKRALKTRSSEFTSTTGRGRRKRRSSGPRAANVPYTSDESVIITGPITVGELAEIIHASPAQVITQLIGMGTMATINQQIPGEQAVEVIEKMGFEAVFMAEENELAEWRLHTGGAENETEGEERPPVVTILGHVDHGKTTLLDSIRKTNVTASEFGGITQHIGAYQVDLGGELITFLDTPGHAAFTAMRARGANLTDIAVLVVAADDGIQPQTIEAIDHAKAAKVPIIVAINKVDLPDAQPEVVKQQLSGHGLVSEDYGGDVTMVQVSAKKGEGIDTLLEMILLTAELLELHGDPNKPAKGAVVESRMDRQRGAIATLLIQEGTLKVGDALVVGMVPGRVRAMTDDKGSPIKSAGPSTPVQITGLGEVPVAGDLFEMVADEKKAREIAEQRRLKARAERLQATVSLQDLSNLVASGLVNDLNVIVKCDVAGSIEAISHALGQIEQGEIRINLIHAGVGDVSESDVLLASASQAIIVGFHVRIEAQARAIAEEAGTDVRIYQVIYDLVDDIEKAMVGMLKPVFEEAVLGHAEVLQVFRISKLGSIAGSRVRDGLMRRGAKVRVLRSGEKVKEGNLDSLKHLKEDVREMAQGFECGISIDGYNDWQEGDIIECYVIRELRRETL